MMWLGILIAGLILSILYGYYPRALEKAIAFEDIDVVRDEYTLKLTNEEYTKLFMRLNEMHIITSKESKE
jgi:hypothetical protein